MANISLKRLFEAEDFKAKSKETGKLVHFKSKDSYDAAIKAGSHENPNTQKGGVSKGDIKPNDMFGGDYSKDRGAKDDSKLTSMLPKSDSGIKEKTNRDTQIDKLSKEKETIDKEWSEKYKKLSDAEFEKYDRPLQQKSNAIQKQMDDLEPSTISFGKKTQKAVSDWFDVNKIPYELKAGSNSNTPELQFDSKDLPKDKVKELVQLAKHVQKEDGIGIDGDLDSTLYMKNEGRISLSKMMNEDLLDIIPYFKKKREAAAKKQADIHYTRKELAYNNVKAVYDTTIKALDNPKYSQDKDAKIKACNDLIWTIVSGAPKNEKINWTKLKTSYDWDELNEFGMMDTIEQTFAELLKIKK